MKEETLSQAHLNRALLARQLLLERASLTLPKALEQVAGLQTQYAPSGYIGLFARLQNFKRSDLTGALEQRRVVQGTSLRSTIHLLSAADFPIFAAATRPTRLAWWRKVVRHQAAAHEVTEAARLVEGELLNGPRSADELREVIERAGFPRLFWNGVAQCIDMVRVPPSGTWERRRADLYTLARNWLPNGKVPDEDQAIKHLVRRYLAGFGPAPIRDIAAWSGLPPTRLKPIVLGMSLSRYRDDKGAQLFDLPNALIPDANVPPVRFLPHWDATLLVHARRTGILPEQYRPLVFNTKTPHSVATFIIDGAVRGKWRYENDRIVLEAFAPIPPRFRKELDEEMRRLEGFHQD